MNNSTSSLDSGKGEWRFSRSPIEFHLTDPSDQIHRPPWMLSLSNEHSCILLDRTFLSTPTTKGACKFIQQAIMKFGAPSAILCAPQDVNILSDFTGELGIPLKVDSDSHLRASPLSSHGDWYIDNLVVKQGDLPIHLCIISDGNYIIACEMGEAATDPGIVLQRALRSVRDPFMPRRIIADRGETNYTTTILHACAALQIEHFSKPFATHLSEKFAGTLMRSRSSSGTDAPLSLEEFKRIVTSVVDQHNAQFHPSDESS